MIIMHFTANFGGRFRYFKPIKLWPSWEYVCCIAYKSSYEMSMTSRWTETRGLTNSPTSMTTCSPRNWAANGD